MAQIKRKKFFDVEIPLIEKETQLLAYEESELENRFIKYDLTRVLKGKSIDMQFKVRKEGTKFIAHPKKLQVMSYFIRRMMRKGTNYVEESFSAECKDSILLIKPFLITRRKVSRKVRKTLRDMARSEIKEYIKNKTAEVLFREILENKLQKSLSLKLKKIYPLSFCEIRVLKIVKDLEDSEKKKEVEDKEVKKEVKEEKSETKEKKASSEKKEKPKKDKKVKTSKKEE